MLRSFTVAQFLNRVAGKSDLEDSVPQLLDQLIQGKSFDAFKCVDFEDVSSNTVPSITSLWLSLKLIF